MSEHTPPLPSDDAAWEELEKAGNGLMIALWVPASVAGVIALPGGERPEDLHVTLAYLGKNPSSELLKIAHSVAETASSSPPLVGRIGGVGRFNASSTSDGMDVLYAAIDVPGLSEMRHAIVAALAQAGVQQSRAHDFTPHATLAYIKRGARLPVDEVPALALQFSEIVVVEGPNRTGYPFKTDKIELLMRGMEIADEAVAKAGKVSEVAQIARAEVRLRRYLQARWRVVAQRAADAAGADPARAAQVVARAVAPFGKDTGGRVAAEVRRMYRLARVAAWKRATGRSKVPLAYGVTDIAKAAPRGPSLPQFSVVDRDAAEALVDHQLFWIKENYEENVSEAIARTASEVLVEAGEDRAVAGELMRSRVGALLGALAEDGGYFESVAANAATVARAHGAMRSFQEAGVEEYEIVAVGDERTCPVCSHADGKRLPVSAGLAQANREVRAKTPSAIKSKIHPWLTAKVFAALDTPEKMVDAGQALPPFHFRCRCVADIVLTEKSIAPAWANTAPTMLNVGHFRPERPVLGTLHEGKSGKRVIWDGSTWVAHEDPVGFLPPHRGHDNNPKTPKGPRKPPDHGVQVVDLEDGAQVVVSKRTLIPISGIPQLPEEHRGADFHALEPTWLAKTDPEERSYGGVMFNEWGEVLLRAPSDGDEAWTFAKGMASKGDRGPADTAIREVGEETGYYPQIIGVIPGVFSGRRESFFFLMRSLGYVASPDDETQKVGWFAPEQAWKKIEASPKKHRRRDQALLLAAARALDEHLFGGRSIMSYFSKP